MVRSSRSRSRSPRERERLDRFGRVIPPNKRSRSRSRSRDRRRRSRSPGAYRSRHHERSRSSSRSRSQSRGDHSSSKPWKRSEEAVRNRTNIEDPEFLNARLFIGSLPSDRVNKEELEEMFKIHGKILGVSVHERGFGFVQFEKEEDARKAKDAENGTKLKGSVLDVKMAAEGRRSGQSRGPSNAPAGRGAPPPGREYDARESAPGGYPGRGPPPGPPGRERSPIRGDPYEDRYRDPYRRDPLPPPREGIDRAGTSVGHPPPPTARDDPYFDPYRRPLPPPPHDDPYRDPYREDPYRRDPYRRDPYDDPYRDPYYRDPYLPPPPPKKPMPADVQIICMNKQLEVYAESIDNRLRQSAMITDIIVIPEDLTLPQMVEEAARLKFLFAIIINSQNEAHKSLTLNILHSTPQEHRNMPLEDAMKLVASSFEKYIQTQREKTAPKAAAATPPAAPAAVTPLPGAPAPAFVPPSSDISYLLNLLADNRQLTLEEIDKVFDYLKERKDKMMIAEGRRPVPDSTPTRAAPSGVPAPGGGGGDTSGTSAYLQQQQQELQNKILNILNGSGSTPNAPPAPTQSAQGQGYGGGGSVMSTGRPQPSHGGSAGGPNPLINFDNPNVQKALDNLIQSGPSLLKSIPSNVTQQAPAHPSQYPGAGQGAPRAQSATVGMGGYPQKQQPQAQSQPAPSQSGGYGGQFQYQQPQAAQKSAAPPRGIAMNYGGQQRPAFGVRAPQQGVRQRY